MEILKYICGLSEWLKFFYKKICITSLLTQPPIIILITILSIISIMLIILIILMISLIITLLRFTQYLHLPEQRNKSRYLLVSWHINFLNNIVSITMHDSSGNQQCSRGCANLSATGHSWNSHVLTNTRRRKDTYKDTKIKYTNTKCSLGYSKLYWPLMKLPRAGAQ